jgi:hypothetical protein
MLNKDYLAVLASQPANGLTLHSFLNGIANIPIEDVVLVSDVDDRAQRNSGSHRLPNACLFEE